MNTQVLHSSLSTSLIVLAVALAPFTHASSTLVGLWRFDESDRVVAKDSSGLGNDGTLTGDEDHVPTRVSGQAGFGGALRFSNNGIDHSLVSIPASALLKIGLTADDTWTIACWAREESDGFGNYVATYGRVFAFDGGLGLNFNSGAPGDSQFWIWHNSLTPWQQAFGTEAAVVPILDQWVHLALVYDGQSLSLYRNGNQGVQGAKSSLTVRSAVAFNGYGGSIQIGTMPNMDGTRNWNGLLDDFAVFKGALSETEVRAIMTGDFSAYLGAGAPKIASEPADQAINQGLNATFSVVATSDTPMTYQWQFNGKDLAGATGSSLTLTNVQLSQAGTYSVVVRNASGATPSRGAALTVLVPLPPRLVGLWRFDEGGGDQVRDGSGLTNHGVLVGENGNTPIWAAGQSGFGQALQFQNNGADHCYVDVQASDSLKIGLSANDTWTIALWARETSDGADHFVATYGRLFAFDGGFGLNFNSGAEGDAQFWIWHNSLGAWQQGFGTTAAIVPVLDQWVHLALVYDGQSLTTYRNGNQGVLGVKMSLPVRSSVAFDGYSGAFQIGTMLNMSATRNWNGLLDDVAIFTGALSEPQVRMVMAGDFTAFLNLAPLLAISPSGSQAIVSWGFGVLQSTTAIGSSWQDETNAVSPLQLTPTDARRFYRVKR